MRQVQKPILSKFSNIDTAILIKFTPLNLHLRATQFLWRLSQVSQNKSTTC